MKEKVNLAPPRDVTKARNIIGLASYNRKFVANFSNKANPLTELAKKTTFSWNPHCQQSLHTIKAALTNSQTLIFPDTHEPCVSYLQILLSTVGLGYPLRNA